MLKFNYKYVRLFGSIERAVKVGRRLIPVEAFRDG